MAGTRGGTSSQPQTPPAAKSKKRSAQDSSPTTGDATTSEPKRKRGRPSKAEIAAREARQSQASQASENGTGASSGDDKMEGVIAEATKSNDPPMTPPGTKKKRGRPSKADKEKSQLSTEESTGAASGSGENIGEKNGEKAEGGDEMTGVEVEKPADTSNGTNGDAQAAEKKPEESNGHTDDVEVKKPEEHTNGTNGTNDTNGTNGSSDGPSQEPATEKNALDLVKSGLDEAPKPAETEKVTEPASDNTKPEDTKPEETKPEEPVPSNGASEKEPEETTKPEEKDAAPVVDTTVEDNLGDDISVNNFARVEQIPSSILEKGIIYFFFRARVNVEEPQGIEDVARSYIILRPLPIGAKITEGVLSDDGNARLLALPKKKLPASGKDKFLVFVEKKGASVKELREQLSGSEYATQTSGTSNAQAATPFAEGIYALTSTEVESHLAYHITVPSVIGDVQNELGLKQRGSFIVSAKNPENNSGSNNIGLEHPAKYPEALQSKFRGLKWMPLIPDLLEHENTQFLVIGEGAGTMGKALDEMSVDQKDGEKEKPEEEMSKLVEEDHDRIAALKDDDPIFADLGLSVGEYPKLTSTWSGSASA